MSDSNRNSRKLAADIIRGAGALGTTIAGVAGALDPRIEPITKFVDLVLGFVATLVENVGMDKSAELLEDLSKHPATPITDAELAADVAAVKREFNIPSTIPPNPFED